MEQTRRVVHMHVPKTAGTALRIAFEQQYQPARRFTDFNEAKYKDIDPAQYDFFSGHFGFNVAERLGGEIVTVLRNPVDRFMSVYYFWRQLHETGVERSSNTVLASRFSLGQFALIKDHPGLLEECHNRVTWQIAFGSNLSQRQFLRSKGCDDDAVYSMATANLAKTAAVGVQEDLRSFTAQLKAKFGIDLALKRINITKQRPAVAEMSVATRRAIQDWVYMDTELYHHVLREGLSNEAKEG
jgi:hypothetical protein